MTLRSEVLRGVGYLAARQLLAMVLGVLGLLLVTRLVGPKAYGLYAGAVAIQSYVYRLGQLGIGVYLVRKERLEDSEVESASSVLLALAVLWTAGLVGFTPLVQRWTRLEGLAPVLCAVALTLPVQFAGLVPMALLERGLKYRAVAWAELAGLAAFFAMSIGLALAGLGVWSLVIGWWAQSTGTAWLAYRASGLAPRASWVTAHATAALRYGLSYAASVSIWQVRDLVNPVVVGRYAGVEAVGFVALAIRLVEALSFVRGAVWRISLAVLAKIQGEPAKLLAAITDGMRLQVLALGHFLLGFGAVAPWAVPLVFGKPWLGVLAVYPFIALSYLANSLFNLHSSALYVLRENWAVTRFHIAHVILFLGGAVLLVPRLGVVGYGFAEAVALASYLLIHREVVRRIGRPDYHVALVWAAAFGIAFFWYQLGLASLAGLGLALAWPVTWRVLRDYWRQLQEARL